MTIDVTDPRAVSKDVFSATIGSLCCCYSGQPLDIVKVRMQTIPMEFTNAASTVLSIFRNEGLMAFWKGSVPTAMGMMNENVVAFGINEALKRTFPDDPITTNNEEQPNLLKPFLLGPITGCSAAMVLAPAEVVKAKTQMSFGSCPKDIARQMLRKHGIKSFFCGLEGQFMRDGFFYTVFFGGYEVCKYTFRTCFPSIPDGLNFYISGGLAGMAGWAVAIPFDAPKTVAQANWDTRVFGDYFPTMIRIAKERGIRNGLYRGLDAALGRAFIANSALFLGVETGKRYFDAVLWQESHDRSANILSMETSQSSYDNENNVGVKATPRRRSSHQTHLYTAVGSFLGGSSTLWNLVVLSCLQLKYAAGGRFNHS